MGFTTNLASGAGVSGPTNAVDCCFADYDNDGLIDLYVTASDGYSCIYKNGSTQYGMDFDTLDDESGGVNSYNCQGVSAVDIDGDGRQSFYVTRYNGYSAFMEKKINNSNNWLGIKFVPTASNKSAVGAVVMIDVFFVEYGYRLIRTVEAGSGWGSQGSRDLHIGLGGGTKDNISSMTVYWPSGAVQSVSSADYNLNEYFCFMEVHVKIEIDTGQCGVNGDEVKSNKGETGEKHYVSPKEANEYVFLKAIVTPDTEDFEDHFEWVNGEAVFGYPEKRMISRSSTGKTVVTVTEDTVPFLEQDRMNVWIVWATIDTTGDLTTGLCYLPNPPSTSINGEINFEATISPSEIITDDDRPKFDDGENPTTPPSVPAGDTTVLKYGDSLALGASGKWDMSREIRMKLINPNNINFTGPPGNHDKWDYGTYVNWPNPVNGENVCGNDDFYLQSAYNPYDAPQGKLSSGDTPTKVPIDAEGNIGDTFEVRQHFREFVRLNIGDKWYRISDPDGFCWRIHFKFKKYSEDPQHEDEDINGDDDKLDEVWKDDGTDIAEDNNGWN